MQAPFNPNQLELSLEEPVLKLSVYYGDYWVKFPMSEYGGTWAVLAQNKADCINMLYNACTDCEIEGYEHDIAAAVDKAMVFDVVAAEGQFSKVVSFFRT